MHHATIIQFTEARRRLRGQTVLPDPIGPDWRMLAIRCQHFPHLISRREMRILGDIWSGGWTRMSIPQRAAQIEIVGRLRSEGCGI